MRPTRAQARALQHVKRCITYRIIDMQGLTRFLDADARDKPRR